MTDITKYRNVSLTKETYSTLEKLSKVILPNAKLSISKTVECIANEKATRPYAEVAQMVAMLASLKQIDNIKDDKSKKDLS